MRVSRTLLVGAAAFAFGGAALPTAAAAAGPITTPTTGGAGAGIPAPTPTPTPGGPTGGASLVPTFPVVPSTPLQPTVPGAVAKIIKGVAYAPSWAPIQVKRAIWAGDQIRLKPYIWGGGHQSFKSTGYDCSGSVSYVLHAAGLLTRPDDSSDFYGWGTHGLGRWMTVYTNPGHAFIEIAGIRLDTSAEGDPHPAKGSGPRWRPLLKDTGGFSPRHPVAF